MRPGIETVEDRDRLAYERLTLRPPRDDGPLLAEVFGVDPARDARAGHGTERGRTASPCSGRRPGSGPTEKGGSSVRPWTRSSSCPSSRTCPRARSDTC